MSSTALMWAAGIAPVADVQEYAVLIRMADEADESGCGVYLATATIADDIKVSEKTVQRRLDAMLDRKLIGLGDQSLARRIRADRRPVVYDLLIPAIRFSDLAKTNKRRAEKGLPPITETNRPDQDTPTSADMRARRSDVGKARGRKLDEQLGHVDEPDIAGGVTISPPVHGVTISPPVDATGGLPVPNGVTTSPERGDYQSPNPGVDPGPDPGSTPLPPRSATSDDSETVIKNQEEGDPSQNRTGEAELLLATILGRNSVEVIRRPIGRKHTTLVRLVADRLAAGWTADQITKAIGDPLIGASSVYAVLKHRLDDLAAGPPATPSAPSQRAKRRCNKGPGHEPYSATNCPMCVLDAENAEARDAAMSAPSAAEARAAARAIAASCGTGRKIELTRRPRGLEGKDPAVVGAAPARFGSVAAQITGAWSA